MLRDVHALTHTTAILPDFQSCCVATYILYLPDTSTRLRACLSASGETTLTPVLQQPAVQQQQQQQYSLMSGPPAPGGTLVVASCPYGLQKFAPVIAQRTSHHPADRQPAGEQRRAEQSRRPK